MTHPKTLTSEELENALEDAREAAQEVEYLEKAGDALDCHPNDGCTKACQWPDGPHANYAYWRYVHRELPVHVNRLASDVRLLRDLLERAYEQACTNDGFNDPPCDPVCSGCTWNAERKRALDGMK